MKYEKELTTVIKLVKEIGPKIIEINKKDFDYSFKSDDSPLTEADLLSSKMLVEGLEPLGHGILSEENVNLDLDSEFVWVVDPLDGTKDFIQRTGQYSIMVGLLKNRRPVLGVVYAPELNKLYYAVKGDGAYLLEDNKKTKLVVSKKELKDFSMVISRNHFRQEDKDIALRLGIEKFSPMGSVGVKYGVIAEGKAELCAYTAPFLGVWDCCGPHMIIKEAGGDIFDTDGNEPSYDLEKKKMAKGFIGTNGQYKEKIFDSIKKGLN